MCSHKGVTLQPLLRMLQTTVCIRAEASLCQHACVCGMMIDDKHGDKSSNHPARELKARWFLFLKSGMFL